MDWFHAPTFTVNHAALHASGPPTADNVLVNGTMTSVYGGKYAETTLTPGKLHRLRLINTGINNNIHASLDGHPFTVVAADLTPIKPYTANSVNIAVGKLHDEILCIISAWAYSRVVDVSLTRHFVSRTTI
jgi:FtsP/CotA-like multicopper oxidase with cupredoxin domain